MFIELEEDNLKEKLDISRNTIIMFGAGWCGNCRILKPKVKRLSTNHTDIDFYYVDADKFPNSRYLVKLTNLPTTIAVKNGDVVGEHVGNKVEGVGELITNFK